MVMGGLNQNITFVTGAFSGTEPNLLFSVGGATRLTLASTGTSTFDTTAAISATFNSTNANGAYIGFRRSGTSIGYLGNSAQLGQGILNALELRADNNLFLTTTSGLLAMTSGGSIGIGIATPLSTRLDVRSNASYTTSVTQPAFFGTNDATGPLGIVIQTINSGGILRTDITSTRYGVSGNDLSLNVDSSDPNTGGGLYIKYRGNVGIGTNNPEHKLDVRSPSGNNIIRSNVTITSDGQQAIFSTSAIWSGAERGVSFSIYKHSAITNPASYVSFFGGGSAFRYMFIDDSGVLRLSESSSDIGTYGGTVVGTQTSDIRLKNIKDEFNYGLKEILQINPIAFTFKKDENQVEKLGFAAQEIINIIPESVYDTGNCIDGYEDTDDPMLKIPKSNDTILAMDYSVIIPVLVKAIQEQQQQIDKLKNL
jgi:hypothetical protein